MARRPIYYIYSSINEGTSGKEKTICIIPSNQPVTYDLYVFYVGDVCHGTLKVQVRQKLPLFLLVFCYPVLLEGLLPWALNFGGLSGRWSII